MVRPRESNSRPPALQSSALQTELILPRLSRHELPKETFLFIFSVKKLSHKGILTQTQAYELHMQKMSRVANFVNKPSGASRYIKKTTARVLFPPHPCPESMLQAMELRKRKCCHRVQRRCVCRYNIKTRRNL